MELSTLFFIYVSAIPAVFGFNCTRPTPHPGYNAPTSDPSSLSTTALPFKITASPFNDGTVTSGTYNFIAECAHGYRGTVSASCRTISNEAYRLSGCTNCIAGKHTEFDPSWTAVDIDTSAYGASSVFVADMDGDGDMDIVSASSDDNTIAWYKNDGYPHPSWTAVDIDTSAYGASSVFVADMDGDGDMDIVSISSATFTTTIAWYKNDRYPHPSWTAVDIDTSALGASSVFVADMDGDGDMDIVSANFAYDAIAWYENDGNANPSWSWHGIDTSASGASSVFVADMDGDGDMDIVSASFTDDTIAWYENDGNANPSWTADDIATSAEGASSVFVADMDGDGDMDIVSASFHDNTIAWYENDGHTNPSWTAVDIDTSALGASSVFVADMDGDGDMDIVSASSIDNTIAWYENNGNANPSWTAVDIDTSAYGASSVFVADMDGDGDMDIVSASSTDNTFAWYENDGNANCVVAACTAVDTPYVGCTVPACTAVDTPYAGCTLAACTAVDTPYAGCTLADCTAVDTPYAGCSVSLAAASCAQLKAEYKRPSRDCCV